MNAVDVYIFPEILEKMVLTAYMDENEVLEPNDVAPHLVEVYFRFYGDMVDNITDAWEDIMGVGTPIREDWLLDIGIDRHAIPDILTVCKILNKYSLGYFYDGTLYNLVPRRLSIYGGVSFAEDYI